MEPILSKLQEGVKYPRFERDATKTINDLVDHITKERGVYSSSIEPNPSEHSVWFNTDNNTLYIYNEGVWETVSDKNIHISKEVEEFLPYPVINILNSTSYIAKWYIEENKHYVIIISANNIRKYLNNIVDYNEDNERQFIIIGDDTNVNGTFLVNIYDTYIYYIKLSSTNIEEDNVFYCNGGLLYYNGEGTSNEGDGIDISGFYTENRLKNEISNYECDTIENISLNGVFIEPESDATIIIGKQDFVSDIAILGEDVSNINIYMYNNQLKIGGTNDNISLNQGITWNNANVFCNCKHIDSNIIATHENSSLSLNIDTMSFVVSNNNYLIITSSVCSHINELYVNVIKETDDDNASVYIQEKTAGAIEEYINLCGTSLKTDVTKLPVSTFITTTISDIDVEDVRNGVFDINNCELLIIDAPYRTFNHTNSLYHLQSVGKLYGTSEELINYLYTNHNVQMNTAINETIDYNDRVEVTYRDAYTSKIIYNKTIYKR